MQGPAEYLTQRFYEWEVRGRGWYTFDEPVRPEPPFVPFWGHFIDGYESTEDDGRQPTRLSSLADRLLSFFQPRPPECEPQEEPEVAISLDERERPTNLSVVSPPDITYPKDVSEQFLLNLSQCRQPICLEFLGKPGAVTVHLIVDSSESDVALTLLQSHFAETIVAPSQDWLVRSWNVKSQTTIVEFGLSEECMLPLRSYRTFVNAS